MLELERTLAERDAQMDAQRERFERFGEEVAVLAAEGLSPSQLVQELLLLRWGRGRGSPPHGGGGVQPSLG